MLDLAESYALLNRSGKTQRDLLRGRTLINLFFEYSSRTRTSFVLAGKRLGADVINMSVSTSSVMPGRADASAHKRREGRMQQATKPYTRTTDTLTIANGGQRPAGRGAGVPTRTHLPSRQQPMRPPRSWRRSPVLHAPRRAPSPTAR